MNKRIKKKVEKKRRELSLMLSLIGDMPENEGVSLDKSKSRSVKKKGKANCQKKIKKGGRKNRDGVSFCGHAILDVHKSTHKEFGKSRSHARTSRGFLDGSVRK